MKVQQNINTKEVTVAYVSMHRNHGKELAHLPIPCSVRLKIASLLHQGVPIQGILDRIWDNESDQWGCEHLINQWEVRNIHAEEA